MLRRVLVLTAAVLVLAASGYADLINVRSHRLVSVAADGPYRVGRTARQYVDRSRTDEFSPIGGNPRELAIWLWYPAAATAVGAAAGYAPGPWSALNRYGFAQTDFAHIATGAIDDALMATGTFPLVMLTPGLGYSALQYSALASSLASHGYIVAGVTPSYSATTVLDGQAVAATAAGLPRSLTAERTDQLVTVWSADARYAAAETRTAFGSRVDRTRTLYVGHALGGAASAEACRLDPGCAGAVALDGTGFSSLASEGLTKPLLLLSPASFPAGVTTKYAYTIDGTATLDFTDYAIYYLPWPVRSLLPLGSIDGRRALTIAERYVTAFADTTTRGVTWSAPDYSEVRRAATMTR